MTQSSPPHHHLPHRDRMRLPTKWRTPLTSCRSRASTPSTHKTSTGVCLWGGGINAIYAQDMNRCVSVWGGDPCRGCVCVCAHPSVRVQGGGGRLLPARPPPHPGRPPPRPTHPPTRPIHQSVCPLPTCYCLAYLLLLARCTS